MSGVNFSDYLKAADDAGFTVIPKNDYDLEVATAEAKKTANGKDQIVVRLKVLGGPYDGKSVFNNFVLSPDNANALSFFFRHLAAFGLHRAYFDANPSLAKVAQDLVGRRARGAVSTREFNGTERNQVDNFRPIGGPHALAQPATAPRDAVPPTPATPPAPMPGAQYLPPNPPF